MKKAGSNTLSDFTATTYIHLGISEACFRYKNRALGEQRKIGSKVKSLTYQQLI